MFNDVWVENVNEDPLAVLTFTFTSVDAFTTNYPIHVRVHMLITRGREKELLPVSIVFPDAFKYPREIKSPSGTPTAAQVDIKTSPPYEGETDMEFTQPGSFGYIIFSKGKPRYYAATRPAIKVSPHEFRVLVQSQPNKDQGLINKFYDLFNVIDAKADETKIFKNLSHEQLLNSFKKWLENKKFGTDGTAYSIIIHSRHEEGIDVLVEFSKSRIGIQIHSYLDIKGEKEIFGSKVTRQIGESLKHTLDGRIIIYCGDMTDTSQKDKILKSMSEVSRMSINARCVPPEKAIVIIKQNL